MFYPLGRILSPESGKISRYMSGWIYNIIFNMGAKSIGSFDYVFGLGQTSRTE